MKYKEDNFSDIGIEVVVFFSDEGGITREQEDRIRKALETVLKEKFMYAEVKFYTTPDLDGGMFDSLFKFSSGGTDESRSITYEFLHLCDHVIRDIIRDSMGLERPVSDANVERYTILRKLGLALGYKH